MSVNAKMTAIAEAIRAKTGKTAALTLDQMASEIAGISGGTEMFAAIGVTYPAGSTLTCTNVETGEILTANPKTEGNTQWVFAIPEAGTWTVKCFDGADYESSTNKKSETVAITAEGQSVNVELNYQTYFFKENEGIGDEYTLNGISPSFSITNANLPYVDGKTNITAEKILTTSSNSGNNYWINEMVNVSGYKKLNVEMKCTGRYSAGYSVTIGVGSDAPVSQKDAGNFIASTAGIYDTTRKVHSVELESVSGEVYVKINAYAVAHEIYNWWLE